LSLFTRFRPPAQEHPTAGEEPTADGRPQRARRLGGGRLVATRVITVLAVVLVLFGLLAPNRLSQLTPGAFVRIPLEAVLGAAVVLALPGRARRPVAAVAGVILGLLTILKIIDMGFITALSRPFDPVLDWSLFDNGVELLTASIGRAGAMAAVVGAVVLAVAVLVLMTLSVLRLNRVLTRHDSTAPAAVTVLLAVWVTCNMLGAQIVPGVPVTTRSAATLAYDRSLVVRAGLQDRQAFAAAAAVDAFRDTPGDQLLTALRGKDVIVTIIESYGRDAVEDPVFATQVGAVLDAGTRRLAAAGYASRSAFLTSPTTGGGSWLAQATLRSGLWIDNQQRFRTVVSSDRLTLGKAFQRANWQTVGVAPGVTRAWPEGTFYGYDRIYDSRNVGYRGAGFGWATMPDQYTLAAFERSEHGKPGRPPLMAEIPLISSHWPWAPIPRMIGWNDVGDGAVFNAMAKEGDSREVVWKNSARVRTEYRRSIEYSLNTLISYVETYGDDNLVLVFLGDHQPMRIVTGPGASHDVPITIVARDRAVMDRTAGWGWQDGLKPGPQAPVWRMDAFRDRFLTAFSDPR
jgi:hypothetical protein